MNNEIKEILFIEEQNADYKRLSIDELITLEDYIINLQEKLDFMIDRNGEKQDRIDKAIEYIKDEIEYCDSALSNPEYTIVNKHEILKQEKKCCIKQLNILQGSENND